MLCCVNVQFRINRVIYFLGESVQTREIHILKLESLFQLCNYVNGKCSLLITNFIFFFCFNRPYTDSLALVINQRQKNETFIKSADTQSKKFLTLFRTLTFCAELKKYSLKWNSLTFLMSISTKILLGGKSLNTK